MRIVNFAANIIGFWHVEVKYFGNWVDGEVQRQYNCMAFGLFAKSKKGEEKMQADNTHFGKYYEKVAARKKCANRNKK